MAKLRRLNKHASGLVLTFTVYKKAASSQPINRVQPSVYQVKGILPGPPVKELPSVIFVVSLTSGSRTV